MARSRIVNLANFSQFTAINVLSDPGYDPSNRTIPNCVEVTFLMQLEDAKIAHMVMHARYAGGFTPSSAIANTILAGLTSGAAWSALAAFLATSNFQTGLLLRDLNEEHQPIIGNTVSGPGGTSASSSLPNEVALVITLRTAQVGPGFRGRIYFPGWASNALGAANVAAAAAVTDLNAWAQTIPTVFTASGLQLAIGQHSRVEYIGTSGNVHPARAPDTVLVTSLTVRDNHWDTQRRRGMK